MEHPFVAGGVTAEQKKWRAYAHVSVGALSLLLTGLTALMVCGHRDAPLWLVSELCAVLYLWTYHPTQNLTPGAVVPVEALVFSFPLIFGAGFLAPLLAVAVSTVAGVLVMVADVACTAAFAGFCLGEYKRCAYTKSLMEHKQG